jgi:hypothetical protein
MAPTSRLDLPSTAAGGSDVIGMALVNSFYGPGTPVAWLLTILASLMHMQDKDNTHLVHPIAHMLYTNWASIDLVHQLRYLEFPEPNAESTYKSHSNLAAIAAALTVTFWGLCHTSSQLLYCLTIDMESSLHRVPGTERRYVAIMLGLMLPSMSGIYLYWKLVSDFKIMEDNPPREEASQRAALPALYFDGISESWQSVGIYFAALMMVWAGLALCYSGCHILWSRLKRGSWKLDDERLFYLGVSGFLSLYFLAPGIVAYCFRIVVTGGTIVQKNCYFMPCAPQKISEWDQSFALFVTLLLFVYDFGSVIWKGVKREAECVRDMLGLWN